MTSALNIHINTVHKKLKNYKCQYCNKEFGRPQHLNTHVITTHEKPNNIVCELCGKTFHQSVRLKEHIRSIHEGVKNKCPCGKEFSTVGNLNVHKKNVHKENKDGMKFSETENHKSI